MTNSVKSWLALAGVVIVMALVALLLPSPAKGPSILPRISSWPTAASQSAMKVDFRMDKTKLRFGDTAILTVKVTNTGTTDLTVNFPTSCTSAIVYIDNAPRSLAGAVCAEAITPVTIAAHATQTAHLNFRPITQAQADGGETSGYVITPGVHQLGLVWASIPSSSTVDFSINY